MRFPIPTPISRGAVLALALVAGSACATKNDIRDLRTDLRADLAEITARQDSLRVALLATQDVTRSAQDLTESEMMETRGQIGAQLRTITRELQQLMELAGQNQIAIQNLSARIDGIGSGPAVQARPPAERPREGMLAPGIGGDAERDYADAMELYRSGSLFGAEAAFEDFLTNHPGHEYVPQVHYHLGDIHERNEDFDAALAAFERVGERFPDSDRVIEAEYRIGLIHMRRDEDAEARRVFESIINTWGDADETFFSQIVQQARDRLEELGG